MTNVSTEDVDFASVLMEEVCEGSGVDLPVMAYGCIYMLIRALATELEKPELVREHAIFMLDAALLQHNFPMTEN